MGRVGLNQEQPCPQDAREAETRCKRPRGLETRDDAEKADAKRAAPESVGQDWKPVDREEGG